VVLVAPIKNNHIIDIKFIFLLLSNMDYSVCSDSDGFINFHKNIKCTTIKNKSLSISKYIFETHVAAIGNHSNVINKFIDYPNKTNISFSSHIQFAPSVFIKYSGPIRISRQCVSQTDVCCFTYIKIPIQNIPFLCHKHASIIIIDNNGVFKCPDKYHGFLPLLLPPIISLSKKSAQLKLTHKGENKLIPSSVLTSTHEASRLKDVKQILKKAQLINNKFISDECEYCGIKQYTEAALNENLSFIICPNCIGQNEIIMGKIKLQVDNFIDAYSVKFPHCKPELKTLFLASTKTSIDMHHHIINDVGICDNIKTDWDILATLNVTLAFKKCKLIICNLKIIN
jgi:hypothetical protein